MFARGSASGGGLNMHRCLPGLLVGLAAMLAVIANRFVEWIY